MYTDIYLSVVKPHFDSADTLSDVDFIDSPPPTLDSAVTMYLKCVRMR